MSKKRNARAGTRGGILKGLREQVHLIDAHTHVGIDPVQFARGDYPYGISGEDMALRLNAQGIDAAVCFPMVYSSFFQFRAFRNGRFVRDPQGGSRFPYEAENLNLCREIYEAFPELAGKLLPFAFFDPSRDPKEQVAFLRDLAARYPLFGLKTASSYIQSPISTLLTRGGGFLDYAAEQDIPLTLHTSVHPDDPWANVFEILKVVEARPDVRFDLAHTCRFDGRALERAAALPNCFVDLSAFHIHCLLARRNEAAVAAKPHRFAADYRRHAAAMRKIAETYPETIIWGTDTPYHLFKGRFIDATGQELRMDLPCAPETEVTEFRKLPTALRQRIGHTNTLRWLAGENG